MSTSGRKATVAFASAVALASAVASVGSTYGAFRDADRKARENAEIDALTKTLLTPQAGAVASRAGVDRPDAVLRAIPLDNNALVRAGLEASIAGKQQTAMALMTEALRRDPRSRAVRFWLMNAALKRNDLPTAIHQLDRLMVLVHDGRNAFFPVLAAIAKQPATEAPIAAALQRYPDWRKEFLDYLVSNGSDPALVFRLTAAGGPVGTADTKGGLVQRLINSGDYEAAYLAWINYLPPEGLQQVAPVYDGTFQGLPGVQPFNWSFTDGEAGSVGVERGQGLQINYPAAQSVRLASQTIMLPAGRYVFSYDAHGSPDVPDGGTIAWHIGCLPTGVPVLDRPLSGLRDADGRYAARFEVPADCVAQLLTLEGSAGTFPQTRALSIRRVAIAAIKS